jgi:integrase
VNLTRACEKLGIAGLWIHDFRGTFATEKIKQGYDRALVRRITGHRTDSAFERYLRPADGDLRDVVEKSRTVH